MYLEASTSIYSIRPKGRRSSVELPPKEGKQAGSGERKDKKKDGRGRELLKRLLSSSPFFCSSSSARLALQHLFCFETGTALVSPSDPESFVWCVCPSKGGRGNVRRGRGRTHVVSEEMICLRLPGVLLSERANSGTEEKKKREVRSAPFF